MDWKKNVPTMFPLEEPALRFLQNNSANSRMLAENREGNNRVTEYLFWYAFPCYITKTEKIRGFTENLYWYTEFVPRTKTMVSKKSM